MSAVALLRWRGQLLLAGLLLYLLFLLVQMPAAWLMARLFSNSPVQPRMVSGTVWHGAARQLIWRAENDRIELGGLDWHWLPGELLYRRIGLDFKLGPVSRQLGGQLLLGRDSLVLHQVRGPVDAALLGFVSRPFGLLQPQGRLELAIDNLLLSRKRIHGAAQIDWQGARSGLIATPLGTYRAELHSEPDGRRARIALHTLQGALAIHGNGEYLPGSGVRGTLRLTPAPGESAAALSPLLDLLGRPDAGGTRVLGFSPD